MSHNTFGHLFRVSTWGESHGEAIGCVVDGCPPRIPLSETDIQPWLTGVAPASPASRRNGRSRTRSGSFGGIPQGRHDGHTDRAANSERGPAFEGLRGHCASIPPRSRRRHL